MKNLFLLPLFLFVPMLLKAQDFIIPDYKTKQDYTTNQDDVLTAIQWLKSNPQDHAKRKEANAYVLKWAEGSPTVSIVLKGYIMNMAEKNPDFLMLFIGGWIQYTLENKESFEVDEANHQATKTVVEYYIAGNGSKKDAKLEKLVKLHSKGTLKDWVKKQS